MRPGDSPLLSVLVATLVRREERFLELAGNLAKQAEDAPAPVEIVALQNAGEHPLAIYREALLRDARGKYLCFVDDDDEVPPWYMEDICWALAPGPDVVAFEQYGTGTGCPRTFFGLQYRGAPYEPVLMQDGGMAYLRAYSHMQPIRTEIAQQASFLDSGQIARTTGEDYLFAAKVIPVLIERGSREARIPKVMYSYLWMSAGESTQQGPQTGGRDGVHERPRIESPCFRWAGT
jgi:hypothetical protein